MMEPQAVKIFPYVESWRPMADLSAIVAQLTQERAKLDKAIEALSGVAGSGDGRGTRRLSAAARVRIAGGTACEMAEVQGEEGNIVA